MILITRPKDRAFKLKKKIELANLDCYVEPLSYIKYITLNLNLDHKSFYLVSSPRVIDILITKKSKYQNIKFLVIGLNSSQRLRQAGFKKIIFTAKNRLLMKKFLKTSSIRNIKHLTGKINNEPLSKYLKFNEIKISSILIYETRFKKSLSPVCRLLLKKNKIKTVLLYSQANARHFLRLTDDIALDRQKKKLVFICLSKAISDIIKKCGLKAIHCRQPTEQNLLHLLIKNS